jgi:hypothetical protein
VIRRAVAGLVGTALLASPACGGGGATTGGGTLTAAAGQDKGVSIAEALDAGPTKSVSVRGYLFGFGATGGPASILLCSGPGDPCVMPKLIVTGVDFAAAKQLMESAGALDGLLLNGDGFRETKPVVLTGRLRGNRLEVG